MAFGWESCESGAVLNIDLLLPIFVQEELALGCLAFPSGSPAFGGFEGAGRKVAKGAIT